ncbi:MAG: sulfur carrier protein ThiS adenylyltransferase ThiF [Oligoflexales bacterium]|nr:sulfur carrier protein ThiS adenylyltransferase ThiF [Oligoflexales bacterium]
MIFERNVKGSTEVLQKATIAVAGCGGLGSNAAVSLARAGIGALIIADFDTVEASNLNRQHYFQSDIGKPKTEALSCHLKAINPGIKVKSHQKKLAPDDIKRLFSEAALLIEAFDRAESKVWLIESWCAAFPEKAIICGSGLAGYGDNGSLAVRHSGKIYICGDEKSDMNIGLCAPRVAIVANMQANTAVELLLKECRGK